MATAKQEDSDPLLDSVTCAICMEVLDDPRSLQCMHSFCRKCIQSLIEKKRNKKSVPCPICREDCPIPDQGAAGLKVNFFVNSVLDIAKDRSASSKEAWNCDICLQENEQVPAISKCLDCNEKLCKTCNRAHKRSRNSKLHKILELTGDISKDTKAAMDILSKRTLYCQIHKQEPLKYFCKKDQILICQDCFAFNHQGHQLENIEETAKANLNHLNSVIELGKRRSAEYEEGINKGHTQKRATENRIKDLKVKIANDRELVSAHVRDHFNKLESEVTAAGNESVESMLTNLANLQFDKDAIDSTVKQLEALQRHGHPADIVHMIPDLNAKQEAWSLSPDLEIQQNNEPEFKPSQINDTNIKLAIIEEGEDSGENTAIEDLVTNHNVVEPFTDIIVLSNDKVVAIKSDEAIVYDEDLEDTEGKTIAVPEGWKAVSRTNNNRLAFCYQQKYGVEMRIYNDDGCMVSECQISKIKELKDFVINHSDEAVMVHDDRTISRVDYKSGKILRSCKFSGLSGQTVCNMAVNSKDDIIVSHPDCLSIITGLEEESANRKVMYKPSGDELHLVAHVDIEDNIIVLNEPKSTITILTPDGKFLDNLETLTSCEAFIIHPNSVGDLVIGCQHEDSSQECMYILQYRSEDGELL